MQAGNIRIDRLGPGDWQAYKALRLEALQREPNAFTSTYEEALTRPDSWWQHRLANPRSVMLMARIARQPAGIVGLHLESDEGDASVGVVNGMYVGERYRRQGVGRRLLQTLLDLLPEHPEIATVRLWVTATEEPARRLYASLGFQVVPGSAHPETGELGRKTQLIMERPAQTLSAPRPVDR
jgi:ribosomal protein S18 acetylase RimI-like enzyme